MRADLHSHSRDSDGGYTIDELIDHAIKNKVDVLAVTDHDCVDGSKEAFYISDYENIKLYLGEYVKKNDLIITLGAGNITKLSDMLVSK